MLLRRITTLWGRRQADTDTIDEWARAFQPYDATEAYAALDRMLAAGESGPSAARLITEIRSRRRPEPTPHPAEPDFVPVDPERIRQILEENIALGRAEHLLHLERSAPDAAERARAWRRNPDDYAAVLRRQYPRTATVTLDELRARYDRRFAPKDPA